MLRLALAFSLSLAMAASAQNYGWGSSKQRAPTQPQTQAPVDSPAELARKGAYYVKLLDEAQAFCAAMPDPAYRLDCISERLNYVAWKMPKTGPYADSRRALEAASQKLERTARRYGDGTKPANNFSSQGAVPQSTERPLRAIRPNLQAAAALQARAILAEATTVLLRSSAQTPEIKPQIAAIAAAVGSNKVLLRSA